MPDLSEDVIRQITERVTREVLAALHDSDNDIQVADVYPDWDEYAAAAAEDVALSAITVEEPEPEPAGPSLLRQAARGVVGITDDGDEILPDPAGMRGPVVPIGHVEGTRGGGFDPRGSSEWFVRERQKDLAQRRIAPWETVVKAI